MLNRMVIPLFFTSPGKRHILKADHLFQKYYNETNFSMCVNTNSTVSQFWISVIVLYYIFSEYEDDTILVLSQVSTSTWVKERSVISFRQVQPMGCMVN